jgi:hypothetical protein
VFRPRLSGVQTTRPLAIAFVGGLAVAALRTLVVIPNLYLLAHRGRERLAEHFGRGTKAEGDAPRRAPRPAAVGGLMPRAAGRRAAGPPVTEATRARVLEVHRRLCAEYGCPIGYFHDLDPLSELVSSLLSHRTKNKDSGRAFRQLRAAFPTWPPCATRPWRRCRRPSARPPGPSRRRRASRPRCARSRSAWPGRRARR